jgi:hypothetical protein
MTQMFRFPNPVNEVSARLVAGGVAVMSVAYVVSGWRALIVVITYGFLARVLTGPRLSPLGLLVTRVVTPRLGLAARPVPGPPKRFAQGIGAVLSLTALILAVGLSASSAARGVIVLLVVAATLESVFGLCLGCTAFAWFMDRGIIPARVCVACSDITFGHPAS